MNSPSRFNWLNAQVKTLRCLPILGMSSWKVHAMFLFHLQYGKPKQLYILLPPKISPTFRMYRWIITCWDPQMNWGFYLMVWNSNLFFPAKKCHTLGRIPPSLDPKELLQHPPSQKSEVSTISQWKFICSLLSWHDERPFINDLKMVKIVMFRDFPVRYVKTTHDPQLYPHVNTGGHPGKLICYPQYP